MPDGRGTDGVLKVLRVTDGIESGSQVIGEERLCGL